jgi:hypothetical protein
MRSMSCVLTTTAVVLTLALVSVPAADARPTGDRTPAVHQQSSSWLQAAMTWLSGFLGHHDGFGQALMSAATGTATGTLSGGAQPLTGSCIDPQGGGPRCGL